MQTPQDLTRITLALLFLGMLIAACFWILRPFLPALVWAVAIVVATWPLMIKGQKVLRGNRSRAVLLMTAAMLLVFFLPFSLAVGTIVENAGQIAAWAKSLTQASLPPPPAWLESLPLAGSGLSGLWRQLAALPPEELGGRLAPYAGKSVSWFVSQAGSFGMMFVHVFLTLVFSAILYSQGEWAAGRVLAFARRVAGTPGENSVRLAAQATRAVALGIVVTALAQSVLAGIGLAVAGLPYAVLLTALAFMFSVIQVGPAPVLVPAVVWLYWQGHFGWGTFLLFWSVLVCTLDNFLRPLLIRRGADLPLPLIFAGVLGGLMAFGIIGLFVGPVVLAVSYTLLMAWIEDSGLEKAAAKIADPQPARENNLPPAEPPAG
ncbi:AI-2E family transporter YdiK [Thiovibrio sp. JS02]